MRRQAVLELPSVHSFAQLHAPTVTSTWLNVKHYCTYDCETQQTPIKSTRRIRTRNSRSGSSQLFSCLKLDGKSNQIFTSAVLSLKTVTSSVNGFARETFSFRSSIESRFCFCLERFPARIGMVQFRLNAL